MYFLKIGKDLFDKGAAPQTFRVLVEPDIRFYRTLLVCSLVKCTGNYLFYVGTRYNTGLQKNKRKSFYASLSEVM